MTAVIQNRKGALDAQIHMLEKLSKDMGIHESSLNMYVHICAKHGVKVEVTPYYSYAIDVHTYQGGVQAQTYNPDVYGWDVILTTNGAMTIEKLDNMEQVLAYLRGTVFTN